MPISVRNSRRPLLRNDQHFSVGVVEKTIGHRGIGDVDVNSHARVGMRVAVARHRDQAINEIGGL